MALSTGAPTGLAIRSAEDADWRAMALLAAACFGSARPQETTDTWRSMVPADGAVITCDGSDVVGMALYLDLRLTVPGGAVLPMSGVTWVAVAPSHRRRGVLTEMFVELHRRILAAAYPIAGLQASEAGIYGRFGYGPATVELESTVKRRGAEFRSDVPDPRGVRVVNPAEHRQQLEQLYELWRLRTPGGLVTPPALWDEVFADREASRGGGSAFFALLHDDGFVMYRVHGENDQKSVQVTKFVALTTDAQIALWRVLMGMDLMESVTVYMPPNDLLPYLLTDPRRVRKTDSEDELWLRLLDVPAALEARRYEADVSAVIGVADGVLGGGGRFALNIRDGKARCVQTDAKPDVELDMSVLGSLYLGAHRASAFVAANRLRCNDSALVSRLDAAFASAVPAELGYGF